MCKMGRVRGGHRYYTGLPLGFCEFLPSSAGFLSECVHTCDDMISSKIRCVNLQDAVKFNARQRICIAIVLESIL